MNSAQYVALESQYHISRIATLMNKVDGQMVSRYGSVIFYRADRQDIGSLNDLRGKSFMAPEEDSFGGWQMTLRELRQKGIDPVRNFSNIRFGGSQDAVVRAVLDGEVDAGTVRTGVLKQMVAKEKTRLKDFRVLSAYDGARHAEAPRLISTRSYPEWPLARLQHTPLALAEQVAAALRNMPADAPAAQKAGIAGWTYAADYREVRECLEELQVGPYRPLMVVTLAATLRAYWPWLLGALLTAAGMALTIVMFARMNGRLAVAQKAACAELAERRAAEQRLAAAAEALKDRGEWLNTVVNASADGIIAIDEQGTIPLFNQAAKRIFGWEPGEMLGQPLELLMPEEFRETHRQHLRSYFATGRPNAAIGQALELTGVRRDGRPIPLELSIAANRSAQKSLVVAVFRDISDRKLYEEELQLGKEQYVVLCGTASTSGEARRIGQSQLVKDLAKGSQVTALTPGQANDALAALERLQGFYQSTGRWAAIKCKRLSNNLPQSLERVWKVSRAVLRRGRAAGEARTRRIFRICNE